MLDYTVHDQRPNLLRARLPVHSPRREEDGPLDQEAIRRAAQDSAYTHSESEALRGEPEAVPADYPEQLTREARERFAEHRRRDRGEELARERVRKFTQELRSLAIRMVRAGVDPNGLFADVDRRFREQRRELDEGDGKRS